MVSRQVQLPGPPVFRRRGPWNSLDKMVSVVALLVPGSVLIEGALFTPVLVGTGVGATAVTAVFLLVLWSLETRSIAIGEGWLAVRSRLAPSWVVLEPEDIVEVSPRRLVSSGLAVRVSSGPPVLLRKGELRAGVLTAIRECLDVAVPAGWEAVS